MPSSLMGDPFRLEEDAGNLERDLAEGERAVEPRHPERAPPKEDAGHVVAMAVVGVGHAVRPGHLPDDDPLVLDDLLGALSRKGVRVVLRESKARAGPHDARQRDATDDSHRCLLGMSGPHSRPIFVHPCQGRRYLKQASALHQLRVLITVTSPRAPLGDTANTLTFLDDMTAFRETSHR